MKYTNRREAGRILADLLKEYAHRSDVLVLALPRGGVPVAYEIATHLSVPLDILVVRKLGVPGHEEFAMGAIAPGHIAVFNESVVNALHLENSVIDEVLLREEEEMARREYLYRGNRASPPLKHKTLIVVDDGIATGYSMRAAILALQRKNPANLIIAVPVAAPATCEELADSVKQVICPLQPANFYSVSLWYEDFAQTTDVEVQELLQAAYKQEDCQGVL